MADPAEMVLYEIALQAEVGAERKHGQSPSSESYDALMEAKSARKLAQEAVWREFASRQCQQT